ncbi:stage II sporulation protein M [Methanocaldococcus villosus]|uniref:stage II sporulation protein M n=1 Tax=Methanocaldococcus villosus TaxID=667126 RepID=UPI000475AE12|nr:stage II sporulation protein M [Methanocaldococcus villosus]
MREIYILLILYETIKEILNIKEILKALIRNRKIILFVSIMFLSFFIISYILINSNMYFLQVGDEMFNEFKEYVKHSGIVEGGKYSAFELITFIWGNNLKVCLIDYFSGIFSLLILLINTYILSYVLYKYGLNKFIYLVLPHGIFEIPALILSVSGGILFNIMLFYLFRREFGKAYIYLKESLKILIFSIILFIIAGIIEGTVTFKLAMSVG